MHQTDVVTSPRHEAATQEGKPPRKRNFSLSLPSSTTLKRTATVGVLSLASVLAFVSPASATDLRGKESFNTDKLLMSICNGTKAKTYWWINVETGELSRDETMGARINTNIPYPWERFQGQCTYPRSSSWTWNAAERRISNTLVNCASGTTMNQLLQANGTTTSTTTNSVTGSIGIEWNIIEKVRGVEAGAQYQRSWSYARANGWSTTTGITVSPRKVGWLAMRPEMRTVRSNPHFWVERYSWGKPGTTGEVYSNSWRGRGYRDISSYGAYYDAIGNVLDSNGQPAGRYVARDRNVTNNDC
ncbi:hypothetical protein OG889_40180 [Streptomyces sp. NBC_00481]|uniref:hypothetical protein n=1 Tax=unclassified Streptomyces TaxID=2593676 RepID=UPI002DD9B970|nr:MULTISPECIES: hypothetical protein [unclassified Streptomyces]WRZ00359.1 hypothetical protein OG889_40180 [Streptomyces sp. NBC_00481]